MNKSSPAYGVGIRDITMVDGAGKTKASYEAWHHMLARCYSANYLSTHPTYAGCTVCPEWLVYSVFEQWFDNNYVKGYALDKDCLVRGNKVYGPDACRYIPNDLNALINHYSARVGDTPLGVSRASDKFTAKCHKPPILRSEDTPDSQYLGTFSRVQDAEIAYLRCKASFIVKSAHHYWRNGAIQDDLRGAFLAFAGKLVHRAEWLAT